jgi:two-component system, NarL family, nitrate/nitrite response regulator NarL
MEKSIRIVIADDHLIFIDGIKSLLKDEISIEVVGHAINGEKLIEQVALHKPDMVLTDIQMPVKDGVEATKEIHKKFPAVKIIALTMANESIYIKKMLAAGAHAYVLKTIDKEELISIIKKVASGEKYFSPEVTSQLMNNFSGISSSLNSLDSLTKREKEILAMIAQGWTDKEIAEKVFLSPLTIITHRKNLLSKLGLKNKVELTRFAIDNNITF